MKVTIAYSEISKYVKDHFGKSVEMSQSGKQEVKVTYLQNAIIGHIKVPVSLFIEGVHDNIIDISFSGRMGIGKLVGGAVRFLKYLDTDLSHALVLENGNHITLNLQELSSARSLVENVTLKDIDVTATGLEITGELL